MLSRILRRASGPRFSAFRPPCPLQVEALEDRLLPSTYTAASVAELITDINAANAAGGSNTITLVAGTTFTLTAVDNTTDGPTGLPVIAANDDLTIAGNGDTITRGNGSGTPAFRLFDVAAGGSLTLQHLTLQGGLAAAGGAIYNQGTLTLSGVTVQNNTAQGSSVYLGYGGSAFGGGIYSGGSLTVEDSTLQNNQALGGDGRGSGFGGTGAGGGVFIADGTATLTNVTLYGNLAEGGNQASFIGRQASDSFYAGRGKGGGGIGGGLYVAAGTVTLRSTTADHNTAKGGHGQYGDGVGQGGGLYFASAASACLDAFTQANVTHNSASTSDPDIFGSYTTCP
jgi:hypothetical protein